MSSLASDWRNLQTKTNQASLVGARAPPTMNEIPADMLKSASPKNFTLLTTRTDQTLSESRANYCRTVTGFGGLRSLQVDQADHTYYQPGCGWMYQQAEGVRNPTMNRGVLATAEGPLYGGVGEPDEVKDGISFTTNLEKAERDASSKLANRLGNACEKLALLTPENKPYFGFCTTTQKIIPIESTGSNEIRARFKTGGLGCASSNIVSDPNSCPSLEGFTNISECSLPLSRGCVIQFARESGCTDKGSLIHALQEGSSSDSYDSALKSTEAYKYYTTKATLTPALLRDGSVASKQIALQEFNQLAQRASERPSDANKGVSAAARDLCLQKDYFLDSYDFCGEMTSQTTINSETLRCAQALWRQEGGDSKGMMFPTLSEWTGRTFGQLTTLITQLKEASKNTSNGTAQAAAIRNFIGTNPQPEEPLSKGPDLLGTETVWFYYDENPQNPPIVLKCEHTPTLPTIRPTNLQPFPTGGSLAFTTAFELRPDTPQRISFEFQTSNSVLLGSNQNPKEGRDNLHDFLILNQTQSQTSPSYTVDPVHTNMFVLKWFQGHASPMFTVNSLSNIYLTQEPFAPWLQYEICSRPNKGRSATLGFYEKRWNGPTAYPFGDQTPIPSFDCEWSQVSFITDRLLVRDLPTRGFMSFTTNSWWRTKANFAFNSVKTITLLVRPRATLRSGESMSVMWWPGYSKGWSSVAGETPGLWVYSPDGSTYQFDLWIGNKGHSYMNCKVNDWNLIVLQLLGDEGGVKRITCKAASLEDLRTTQGRKAFANELGQQQNATSSYILPKISDQSEKGYSGPLILGGGNPEGTSIQRYSFTGDIAWLHGFNDLLDEELLEAEVTQTWGSRWPIPPLDTPDKPRQKTIGNNGTVSCDTYCRGRGGGPWNNELPEAWNGARCVSTGTPGVDCFTIHQNPIECLCEPTNNGWVGGSEGFQSRPQPKKQESSWSFKW